MDPSDEELVASVLGGDRHRYEVLVRRYFRAAYVIALAVTGHPEDAEDVCQDAFIRAYTRLPQCRAPDRFGAWLARIVRNRAHNYRRYQILRRMSSLDGIAPRATTESPAVRLDRARLRNRLLRALAKVSSIKRQVVLLHDLEGWTHGAIAHTLGISELMSRRHLSEARRSLRAILEGTTFRGDRYD